MEEGLLRQRLKNWLTGLGIDSANLKIYIESLTHRSFAKEINIQSRGNEQLEFLGDSVVSFIITSYLYKNYSFLNEGKLTKIRASLISSKTLGQLSKEIRLDKQILLGENEESSDGRNKESIFSDAFIKGLMTRISAISNISGYIENNSLASISHLTPPVFGSSLDEIVPPVSIKSITGLV